MDGEPLGVQSATEISKRLWRVAEAVEHQQRAVRASLEREPFGTRDDAIDVRRPTGGIRTLGTAGRSQSEQPRGDGHRDQ
jgi:hypothetical protein